MSATAVALNVTVTDTTAASYLTVYPEGESQPLASSLNWPAADTVANLVIVPLGGSGQVSAFNANGKTDLVVDLEGYFAPESGGSSNGSYGALTPARILDTRTNNSTLGPDSSLNVQVTGEGGIPPTVSHVDAALLNVTVTDTTAPSYLTAYPEGGSPPTASNLNWVAGQTLANRVIVPVSQSTGQISIYNANGSADVVIDVDGYFSEAVAPSNASLYTSVAPQRFIDTRANSGFAGAGEPLGPNEYLSYPMSQIGSLGSDVTAVVSNVTATDTTSGSYFTVYPGPNLPLASDLNWSAGETVPNLTVASVGTDGNVSFYNDLGDVDLVVDVFGYFSSTATLDSQYTTSPNWSGYAEGSGPQTSVTGTFIVPSLYLSSPEGSDMAEWVGIDGFTNDDLIQAGINEYMDPSTPGSFDLSAWWEILPGPSTTINTSLPDLTAGDSITVTISQVSGTNWSITVDDTTQNETFSTEQSYSGALSSSEWIVEAPENESGTEYQLGDYTPTGFTGISTSGPDTSEAWIQMDQDSPLTGSSTPSDPGEGGTSFNIAYGTSVPDPP